MPHIYKETNKKDLQAKNNNEMESNTIKITKKVRKYYKQARKKRQLNDKRDSKSKSMLSMKKIAINRAHVRIGNIHIHTRKQQLTISLATSRKKK